MRARFALAEALEREAAEGGDAEALRQFGEILKLQPDNLAVLLQQARLAAKLNQGEVYRSAVVGSASYRPDGRRNAFVPT